MSTSTALSIPINDIERMAVAAAKSGLFGVKTPDQALALMLVAQAEGLHPAAAARDYHVIQGRPALKADALFARFQSAGGSVKWVKYQDDVCRAVVSHPQGGSVEIEWTIQMAERAGLTGRNPTWKTYPRQMLRSRVISEGVRAVFPGCASGVYTVEEVSDMVTMPASTVVAEPALADPAALVREAPDLEALKDRFREGIKLARKKKDADLEARLTEAKDARKAELEAIPGEVVDSEAA